MEVSSGALGAELQGRHPWDATGRGEWWWISTRTPQAMFPEPRRLPEPSRRKLQGQRSHNLEGPSCDSFYPLVVMSEPGHSALL